MEDSNEGWSLTESDPAIFTSLLHTLGLPSLEVTDLYTLSPSLLSTIGPIHALIFLFKYIGSSSEMLDGKYEEPQGKFYFAKQTIGNACATVALLNSVMNIEEIQGEKLELGEELKNLKEFSEGLDAETAGHVISNSEPIRSAHNSFARSDPFHLDQFNPDDEKEDAYHFIAYLPIGDKVYELDGLRPSPISHGTWNSAAGEEWTDLARSVIERRISTYPPTELNFTLLSLTSHSLFLSRSISHLTSLPSLSHSQTAELADLQQRKYERTELLKEWEMENELRRHNYVGFLVELLKETVRKEGKEGMEKRREEARGKMEERKKKMREMQGKE